MDIFHRFVVHSDDETRLSRNGVRIAELGAQYDTDTRTFEFRISESHPMWDTLESLASKLKIYDLIQTTYSDKELGESKYVNILSKNVSGFPEPSGTQEGWIRASFDQARHCVLCGTGRHQTAPIRAKSVKRLAGKAQTWQMHWLGDLLFVSRNLYISVFKPCNIEHWPVLTSDGKSVIEDVVQLKWQDVCDVTVPEYVGSAICPRCGIRKYLPYYRGFMPSIRESSGDIVASNQYYGDGGEAQRWLYLSQDLYRVLSGLGVNLQYFATSL